MTRSLVYDATHLVTRLPNRDTSGIDRVDLAYGRHFATTYDGHVLGAHYGLGTPYGITRAELQGIVREAEAGWRDDVRVATDGEYEKLRAWLDGVAPLDPPTSAGIGVGRLKARASPIDQIKHQIRRLGYGLSPSRGEPIPKHSVYLNIAQHLLEYPVHFRWLARRTDVLPVFFVHDLLPVDYPEYFPEWNRRVFERRLHTMLRYAAAFITSTRAVHDRLRAELKRRGKHDAPIHVAALPSPLSATPVESHRQASPLRPYFVLLSTIEPRKNHLLVLNIWRELASQGGAVPALVLVGGRGWEHEQVADMIDRCAAIRPHVYEAAPLSADALSHLLRHAQALLMPSVDEGYGLPIVEALSLGTPVVASDIPVFREVTQHCATLIEPIDGLAWRDAIEALAARKSDAWARARATAARFRAPTWPAYFEGVERFLDSI